MIKRILPFVLVFAVLLSFMMSPLRVKADTSSARVDILDFCGVNGSVSNNFTVSNTGVASFDVSQLTGSLKSYHFEILLSWSGVKPTSFSLSNGSVSFSATATDVTSSMIRIYGTCSGYYVGNYLLSITSPGQSYIVFHSFNVDLVSTNRSDFSTTLTAHGGSSSSLTAGGQASVVSPSDVTSALFSFKIPYSTWSKFDYIDFSGFISNGEITAITANTVNDGFIPISTSVIEDMSSRSFFYFSCRLDLTQGNLGTSGDLVVWVNADVIANSGEFGLWGLSGIILDDSFNIDAKWYQILHKSILDGFSSVTSHYLDLTGQLSDAFEEIILHTSETSIRIKDFNTVFQNVLKALSDDLSTFHSSLTVQLSEASDAIILHTSETSIRLKDFNTVFQNVLKALSDDLSTFHSSLTVQLSVAFDAIILHTSETSIRVKDFNTVFQNVLKALSDDLASFHSSLTAQLSEAFEAIILHTSETSIRVKEFNNVFQNVLKDLKTNLSSWFFDLSNKLQTLIDGRPVDESVTDDMQQSEDELGNMTDQMEQLSPTINAGDIEVNVDEIVPQEGLASVSGILSIFTGFNIIASMLTTVMALATVGYVFFGKR